MEIKDATYTIKALGNTLEFSGQLADQNYVKVENFLTEFEESVSSDNIVINFYNLEFLNSSGIKTISNYVRDTAKKNIEVLVNYKHTWQKISLSMLAFLKPEGAVKITKKEA